MKPLCVVSCPIDTFSGYGARSRDFVKSLIEVKGEEWDIKIMPQRWGECPWNFIPQDNPIRQRFINGLEKQPEVWIQITIASEFQPVGKFNIGVSAGIETTQYPGEFIEGNNRMDLNLVSSEHSKNVILSTQYDKIDEQTQNSIGQIKNEKPIEVLFEKWKPQPRFTVTKIDDNSKLDNYNPNPISLTPEFIKEIQSI